jgi:hypothetical protein
MSILLILDVRAIAVLAGDRIQERRALGASVLGAT